MRDYSYYLQLESDYRVGKVTLEELVLFIFEELKALALREECERDEDR